MVMEAYMNSGYVEEDGKELTLVSNLPGSTVQGVQAIDYSKANKLRQVASSLAGSRKLDK